MPFWKNKREEEREQQAKMRESAALQALAQGDIPPIAKERILREKERSNFFCSDLSTREYLLTREAGFKPMGQVMGTSFFRIGFWGSFSAYRTYTGELTEITRAITQARATAVDRMFQEAKLFGASGVIGVHVKIKSHDWASNMTEFTAYGTAIKIPGYPEGEPPFTSSLNGQEFWQLYKAGYLPRSIVMGACAYYIHMDQTTRQQLYTWLGTNREVSIFTEGYRHAARVCDWRLRDEILALQADGAVGVSINPGMEIIEYERNDVSYVDMLLNYTIMGTAVSAHPEREQNHQSPLLVLNLASKKYERLGSSADYDGDEWNYAGGNLMDDDE